MNLEIQDTFIQSQIFGDKFNFEKNVYLFLAREGLHEKVVPNKHYFKFC